jgi:GTP pyrophosphokinase
MHTYAEDGVAAHWIYKDSKTAEKEQDDFQWLKQLTDLLQGADNPGEFLENVRLDLFVQEVYVFSRDGDIFALPRGARPLDFAYAVHTEIGHHCIGVRINGEMADFSTRLRNGDQIEIMTSPDQSPSRQWLQYVRTPRARQAIRQWFRRQEREASIRIGEQLLNKAIGKHDVGQATLEHLECANLDTLKIRLGRGDIPIHVMLDALDQDRALPLKLAGIGRTMMHAAECCHPIPGGIILHHRNCSHVTERNMENGLEVEWKAQPGQLFRTGIEVRSHNVRGMLARVTRGIADASSSIEDLKLKQRGGAMTELLFLVEVEDRKHLASVLRSIKAVEGVVRVSRRNQVGLSGKPEHRAIGETLRDFFSSRKPSEKKDKKKK